MNTLKLMDSVRDMPNREGVKWFEDSFYRPDTLRDFKAVLIYDLKTKVIAVFNKFTKRFVTTFKLTGEEQKYLQAIGNLKTEHLISQQTGINLFKKDVKGNSPVSNDKSTSVTKTHTFENDVLQIIPVDNQNLAKQ